MFTVAERKAIYSNELFQAISQPSRPMSDRRDLLNAKSAKVIAEGARANL